MSGKSAILFATRKEIVKLQWFPIMFQCIYACQFCVFLASVVVTKSRLLLMTTQRALSQNLQRLMSVALLRARDVDKTPQRRLV